MSITFLAYYFGKINFNFSFLRVGKNWFDEDLKNILYV